MVRIRAIVGLPLVASLVAVPIPAANAATAVTVADMAFSPQTVVVGLGQSVEWTFPELRPHTSTSNQGFWDSGSQSGGQTFTHIFRSAGSYPYHCTIHTMMTGSVRVRMTATGSPADGWTLRWSTGPAPADRDFDVQYRHSDATTWRSLRTDTTNATGRFNPTRVGEYSVRARTSNTAADLNSAWSPVRTLSVS